jgi:murein DD-endopeptidase MepM/ murein hydrolase activator NlpD/photosystem II stability/assembly factor-like uncharacterized protein
MVLRLFVTSFALGGLLAIGLSAPAFQVKPEANETLRSVDANSAQQASSDRRGYLHPNWYTDFATTSQAYNSYQSVKTPGRWEKSKETASPLTTYLDYSAPRSEKVFYGVNYMKGNGHEISTAAIAEINTNAVALVEQSEVMLPYEKLGTRTVTTVSPDFVPGLSLIWPLAIDDRGQLGNDYAHYNFVVKIPPKYHTGIDLVISTGTTVRAATDGQVVKIQENDVGCNPDVGGACEDHGYGTSVIVRHVANGATVYTQYSHMNFVAANILSACGPVDSGRRNRHTCGNPVSVSAGTTLGASGASCYGSNCTSPHLHFEVKTFGTLGTDGDDAGEFGYTASDPGQSGYRDPIVNVHDTSAISPPARVLVLSAVTLRVGPGGSGNTVYRTMRSLNAGEEYDAIRSSGSTTSPNCPGGWYQIRPTNGSLFTDTTVGGQIPEGWVCSDSVVGGQCSTTVGQGTTGGELTAFQNAFDVAGGQSVLGCATTPIRFDGFTSFAGTSGHFQTFTSGAIEYLSNGSRAGQAYAVVNPVYNKWASFKFDSNNPLGYPVGTLSSQLTSCFGITLNFQQFEGGALEHHLNGARASSVYEVHGAIYTKWGQKGFAGCPLGLPTSDERDAQPSGPTGRTGRVSDFEGGHIHWWTGAVQAFETHGAIDSLYASMGGTASWLGFPTSDEYVASTGYVRSDFEGGYITTMDGANFLASSRWTTNGPSVTSLATVTSLAIDPSNPNIVYAGVGSYLHDFPAAGVFKSTNGGKNWSAVNNGLGNADVGALAIDPANPTTIYVGTYVHGGTEIGGVFKSTDGGNNWSPKNTGLDDSLNVNALAIDSSNSNIIYAGTSPYSFFGGGVFKSTDGGSNWSKINAGITRDYIKAIAIDPTKPTTLYAGSNTLGGGMFKSTDGGSNWTSIASGLTQTYVNAIAIDPVMPTTVYVGTQFSGGVYKSTNGGFSWSQVNTGLAPITSHVEALAVDPSRPLTIYAGTSSQLIFRSTDGASNWVPLNDGLPANTEVRSLVVDHSGLYLHAGTSRGVYDLQFTPTNTLQVVLDESNQAAALDSVLFLRDPFSVVNAANLFNRGLDQNTRVIVFVTNLQLQLGETSSSVLINLIDSTNQNYDIAAEDVRPVPNTSLTQVIFRLPDNLSLGICSIKVRAHSQISNAGIIRIRN